MTTYTTIPNTDIDQDSPITQPLMTALRDNPIAIAEGDATAPKIDFLAMTAPIVAGDVTRYLDTSTYNQVLGAWLDVIDYIFLQAGTVRVKFELRESAAVSGTAEARILVNGVSVGTFSQDGTTFTAKTQDVTIAISDRLQLQVSHSTSGSNGGEIRNAELATTGANLFPSTSSRRQVVS